VPVATFPQWTAGEDVTLKDGRPLRVSGEDGYDPDDLEEYGAAVAALERAAADIPLDRPMGGARSAHVRRDDAGDVAEPAA
jgi:hypothetical protein